MKTRKAMRSDPPGLEDITFNGNTSVNIITQIRHIAKASPVFVGGSEGEAFRDTLRGVHKGICK